jgi:hypothetical protein
MNIEELDKKVKSLCRAVLDAKTVLDGIERPIRELEDQEYFKRNDLDSLHKQLQNYRLNPPFAFGHSLGGLERMSDGAFEDAIAECFEYRKKYKELKREIDRVEARDEDN